MGLIMYASLIFENDINYLKNDIRFEIYPLEMLT